MKTRDETFHIVVMRKARGRRVSEHFALIHGALTHIGSGMMVPFSQARTLKQARHIAETLEALPFMDWSRSYHELVLRLHYLDDEERVRLRYAAQGLPRKKETP